MQIKTVADAVKFAQFIARKMSRDPEVDSLAGEAAWRALYTFDKAKNVKLTWWIAQLTKQSVLAYWKRLKRLREQEKFMDELWWEEQAQQQEAESKPILQEDWELLVESFILKYPLDVIARERGLSITQATKLRKAAISRLENAC